MTARTAPRLLTHRQPHTLVPMASDRLLIALYLLYLALGKGFAYFGRTPVFVGEVALLALTVLLVRPRLVVPRGWPAALAATFVLAGTAQMLLEVFDRTLPLVESLRGYAIVFYAMYAVLVHAALCTSESRTSFPAVVDRLEATITRAVGWILPVLLLLALRLTTTRIPSPTWPGSGIPVLFTKSTDISVALAFALPFVVERRRRAMAWSRVAAATWVVTTLLVSARSRAGLIAIVIAVVVTFGVRAAVVLRGIVVVAASYLFLLFSGISVRVGQRELSAAGLRNTVVAIVAPSEVADASFEGTTRWRSDWWSAIWHDVTARGMWFRGNGWGTNLAAKYLAPESVPSTAFTSLRLPHNTFLSIAGRAGVFAAVVYLLVPVTTLLATLRRTIQRSNSPVFRALQITLLSGVAVGLTDVYIESPQGGIIFWCNCGALWWWARWRSQPTSDS